jgi:hypothetical protein
MKVQESFEDPPMPPRAKVARSALVASFGTADTSSGVLFVQIVHGPGPSQDVALLGLVPGRVRPV